MSMKKPAKEEYEYKPVRFTILVVIHVIAIAISYALLTVLQDVAYDAHIDPPALVVPSILAVGITAEILCAVFVSRWLREYLLIDLSLFLLICGLAIIFPSKSAYVLVGVIFWLLMFAMVAFFQVVIVSIVNAIKRSGTKTE